MLDSDGWCVSFVRNQCPESVSRWQFLKIDAKWQECPHSDWLATLISYRDNYSGEKYCIVLSISVQMPCCEHRVRVFVRRQSTSSLKSVSPINTNLWWIGRSLSSMEQRVGLHLTFAARELGQAIFLRVIRLKTINTESFSFDELTSIGNWHGFEPRTRIQLVILTAFYARWAGNTGVWLQSFIRPLGVLSWVYLTWWLRATIHECTSSSVEELRKLFPCGEVCSGMVLDFQFAWILAPIVCRCTWRVPRGFWYPFIVVNQCWQTCNSHTCVVMELCRKLHVLRHLIIIIEKYFYLSVTAMDDLELVFERL